MAGNLRNRRAAVLFAAITINFVSGILYIWSIVSKALEDEFHWTSTQASMPYTTATVVSVIISLFAGRLQDLKGPRLCATLGGILMGTGLIVSGLVKSPVLMLITFGIVLGCGISLLGVSATPPVIKWFPPERKGLVIGIVVGGIGFASVINSPLIHMLISNYGVSNAFIFFGIGTLLLGITTAQLLSNPPDGYVVSAGSPDPGKTLIFPRIEKEMAMKEVVKTTGFYKLWLMFAFSSSAGLMIIGHIAVIAIKQARWGNGYLLVILIAIFNTLGRWMGGFISDKIGRINLMKLAFFLQAANMMLFCKYTSEISLAAGVCITGLCYGATIALFQATTADFYGVKNFGANYSIVATAWGAGGIIGPITAARIVDLTGRYHMAYVVSMILLLIAGVVSFTFKNRTIFYEEVLR